ncbi:MAG: glycosyltransferase [Elusimicrobiota bacterium]
MNLNHLLQLFSVGILTYFFLVSVFYLALFCLSFVELLRHQLRARFATPKEILKAKIVPPISVLAPAYNEEKSVVMSVHSLLRLEYRQFEVIVINDGSSDGTLDALIQAFALKKVARQYFPRIPTRPVRAIYRSQRVRNLLVIDKENGGKADSLNAGINTSTCPLFCCIDADSILEKDSLLTIAHPFLEAYSEVVATGGLVRVANGCKIKDGEVLEVRTSGRWLVDFQIVEYFRAFLSGRTGLSKLNCLLVISGAFGLFKKEPVIEAGGYRHDVVGEDMELVVRLHRMMRDAKRTYQIKFLPDPVCWTEVPESMRVLSRQRNRWQRGLAESLFHNKVMLGNPRYGLLGMVAMPYFLLIECLSPVVEITGYAVFTLGLMRAAVGLPAFLAFFMLATVLGVLLSLLALFMEELAFKRYPKVKDLLRLLAAAVLENFGYRQYLSLVRAKGLVDWIRGKKAWGAMERAGLS